MSRRPPPLPMPDGFDQGEDVWRSLTRRQQQAILEDLSEPDTGPEPSPAPGGSDTRRPRPKTTRRRSSTRTRRRTAGRWSGDVSRGARAATAPAHGAVASGAQLVVWMLLLIGLYHALRHPDAFTGAVGGTTRFLQWLTAPRGIPPVPSQQGA